MGGYSNKFLVPLPIDDFSDSEYLGPQDTLP